MGAARIRGIIIEQANNRKDETIHYRKRNIFCFYLFIYGLFNDAVSGSYYNALNNSMINEQWIRKNMELANVT
jgi:uncharacterized membrane protein